MAAASFFGAGEGEEDPLLNLNTENTEAEPVLPYYNPTVVVMSPSLPPSAITLICHRVKLLVEMAVTRDTKHTHIVKPNSPVITSRVMDLVEEAVPGDDKRCLIYCLTICIDWFLQESKYSTTATNLHRSRAFAAQTIAIRLMDRAATNKDFEKALMYDLLLPRFSIILNGVETQKKNVMELAIDLHSVGIISSDAYQKTLQYLWRGWIVQDPEDGNNFITYSKISETRFWSHFNHERIRAPVYQSTVQLFFSIVFVGLYTIAINTMNRGGELDFIEALVYFFTIGYIVDEFIKFWKVGLPYFGFWNIFNMSLYALISTSLFFRIIALAYDHGSDGRLEYQILSYNFLAFSAPMFWMRMVLYLDSFQYFGTMLLVLRNMMAESMTFFVLLILVLLGFFQGFVGMDMADNRGESTTFIVRTMIGTVLGGPDLGSFDDFAHPFGMILYHFFSFIVVIVLLNILIALYSTAYADITANQTDEYMALTAKRILQFVRAPDENVFIPPLNLIEIFCLILPLEWWMPKAKYAFINDLVMSCCYAPFMLIIAICDQSKGRKVVHNRSLGLEDDDVEEEWEANYTHHEEWCEILAAAGVGRNVVTDPAVQELKMFRKHFDETIAEMQEKINILAAGALSTKSGSDADS